MRTPRRILHTTYFPPASDMNATACDGLNSLDIELWPADQCARAMHDEDCANGLWVTNAERSASWPAYGDSQLFSCKGNLDFGAALDAVQTGINEVWMTFEGGKVDSFGALQKASPFAY